MKISARNQFRGTVQAVRKGAVNADVILDLGDGVQLCANITNEAVEELGLKTGVEAVALIKASMILLSPDQDIRISARNRLVGVVSAIIPGSVNCEVKLRLGAARVLTAIITEQALKELALAVGRPCTALIKASHVLIGVND
ncbi:MAG: TOBE domain-containing protein [Steroidobacteraceae bacterium]|jgi:molybdate transport system regulatory protein